MKDRGVLFSAPMVRALLHGSKTQTRRAINPQPDEDGLKRRLGGNDRFDSAGRIYRCPYGKSGDRLWVRETWRYADWTEDGEPFIGYRADDVRQLAEGIPEEWAERLEGIWSALSEPSNYAIDSRAGDRRWRPAIHMPRWASRITLEISEVRVERLQDISEADALAEGVESWAVGACAAGNPTSLTAVGYYALLWESINGAGSWDANPWVWVVSFKRIAT